ncbi:MAG: nucleoside recognition protein [Peptococcaceae bacterium]|nr:nucleoside recognition protein [Peptococcaceae bacterium]
MITADTLRRGLNKGLMTTWELARIVVPVYVFVTFLKHTPALGWLAAAFAPAMARLGLPGEASLALVLGNVLNLYAAIGVITTLTLTQKQVTILAVMLLLCHSIFIETAVSRRLGINPWIVAPARLALSVAAGLFLNLVMQERVLWTWQLF